MGGGEDDDALWTKVIAGAVPLKGKEPGRRSEKPVQPPSGAKPKAAPPSPKPAEPPKRAPAAAAAPLDRRTARELEKGRLEVEARLDLHGMRQRDAHAQLMRFLTTAQARGLRHVLVITGKGTDIAASKSFYEEEEERGVLRQAVPQWLASEDFAPMVVSVSPAPRRLGGQGALYVRLRKAR